MMKKNFLGKFMVLAAMIYAGFTLSSCDEKDNPSGNNWQELKVTNKTATSATVTANSASEVNTLISSLSKDIKAAVTAGKDYTITIDVPSLKATKTDHTISLPAPNSGEDGGTLILYIKNSFSTDDTPLLVKSNEATDDEGAYWDSDSKAEIKLPAGISDIDLEINMPHTSVTLDSKGNATIDELISKTAWNTLNIESGVTVNWLMNKGGYVVVKEGGKILGAIANPEMNLTIEDKGIAVGYEGDIEGDEYFVTKAKIIKREYGNATYIDMHSYAEEPETEVDVIISDGAKAAVDTWGNYHPAVNIIGEGDATITYWGYDNGEGKAIPYQNSFALYGIKKLSNVTVDFTNILVWKGENKPYEVLELAEDQNVMIRLPKNAENCVFISKNINTAFYFYGIKLNDETTSATFKDCMFNNKAEEGYGRFDVTWPKQTEDRASFKLNFDACEINQVKFFTGFEGSGYDDFEGYMVFDNSKVGGKAITKNTDMIGNEWHAENSATIYTIDGADYEPVYSTEAGKWILKAIEAE